MLNINEVTNFHKFFDRSDSHPLHYVNFDASALLVQELSNILDWRKEVASESDYHIIKLNFKHSSERATMLDFLSG